jgi:DNA-binding CsgD family transcriptional regulator
MTVIEGRPARRSPGRHRRPTAAAAGRRTAVGTGEQGVHPEAAGIVGVVRDSMSAFAQRDFDAWANSWVQARHVRRVGHLNFDASAAAPCQGVVQDGWDDIGPAMQRLLDDPSVAIHPNGMLRQNWYVRVRGETAWVTFDQYPLDVSGQPAPDVLGYMRESRILERHSNAWKFTYLGFFHEVPRSSLEAVVRVDERGAIVEMTRAAAGRIGDSEALYVRNGRLRASDEDVDKRLLAAIRDAARANPWTVGTVRIPFLVRTPWGSSDVVCWITSSLDRNGSAVIVLDDALASRRRLQNAILVYRLSPAQARLAEKIIDGHDLVVAAGQLGVTVNTARTHLHRMFEKTGVRTQPALVGALLSVAAPLD